MDALFIMQGLGKNAEEAEEQLQKQTSLYRIP